MLPVAKYQYRRCGKRPELVLTWAMSDSRERCVEQTITYFSRVTCTLTSDKQPLKWTVSTKKLKYL